MSNNTPNMLPLYHVMDKGETCEVIVSVLLLSQESPSLLIASASNRFEGAPYQCAKDLNNWLIEEHKHFSMFTLNFSVPGFVGSQDPNSASQQFILALSELERQECSRDY